MGVACEVIAPSLVPKGASDRVKTDRRDAVRLTLALRAGMLTAVRVRPAEEAVRDLSAPGRPARRPQAGAQRLSAFLLRHGRVWGGTKWTCAHRAWVDRQRVRRAGEQETADATAAPWTPGGRAARGRGPAVAPGPGGTLALAVVRLGAYRGIAELTALTLAAEVVDWRRFATARAFMGQRAGPRRVLQRGADQARPDHQGGPEGVRTALVESAWAYRHRPAVGACCAAARPGRTRRPWPAGRRSSGCTPPGRRWPPAASPPASRPPRSPASSPGFACAEMTS